jgi:hypothetical protein
MPLRELRLDYKPEYEALLRSLDKLEKINDVPPKQFWEEVARIRSK